MTTPAEQLDLIHAARLPAFVRGSQTSKDAAQRKARSGTAARDRRLILAALALRPATQKEMAETLGISRQSLCARCAELSGRYPGWPVKIRQTTERRHGCYVWGLAA